MRSAPSHTTAALDRLMSRLTIGNIDDISRPARSDTSVSSPLASSKRSASCGSRTKARTTRMPVICSRITRLIWSMRSCISWKAGTISATITPRTTAAAGMATARITDSPGSSRTAMTMPTTIVIGAPIAIVQVITTSICTCCTSLVMRVISDGAPNAPTSRAEKSVTWWKRLARRSRPKPIATFGAEVHGGGRERALHEGDEEHHARPRA